MPKRHYHIEIVNEQRAVRVNRPRLVKLAESTLLAERVKAAEISIAIVDDAQIHAINREFLGHDYPTDVISFLLEHKARPMRAAAPRRAPARGSRARERPMPRGAGKSLGGEIIISGDTAVQMAAEYGWRPVDELSLYLVHGLLHLCGYDDLTAAEQRTMRARELEVLEPWRIVPHYAV